MHTSFFANIMQLCMPPGYLEVARSCNACILSCIHLLHASYEVLTSSACSLALAASTGFAMTGSSAKSTRVKRKQTRGLLHIFHGPGGY